MSAVVSVEGVLVRCRGWGLCCFWCSCACCVDVVPGSFLLVGLGGGVDVGVLGLLVENCIVDASILKRSNF